MIIDPRLGAAYFLMLCFSFRIRRTLSSMRCSVISPASTAFQSKGQILYDPTGTYHLIQLKKQ